MSNRLTLGDLEAEYEKLITVREDLEEELRFVNQEIFKIEQEYLK
jgi:hypothetical protein